MRQWAEETGVSCSGLSLLLGTHQVTVYNLSPQNPLVLPGNFLQYTVVFALIVPQRISNVSREKKKTNLKNYNNKAICKSFIQKDKKKRNKIKRYAVGRQANKVMQM